ncbi:MAG: hypothetical protein HRU10_07140 [Opitutales bacterium]|nr:hypothetical protein [Opitutales bacterium]
MKNLIRYLLLFCSVCIAQANNTFPSLGNVGIGTTSPQEKLHVNGASYLRGNVKIFANEGIGNDGTAYLQARDNSGVSDIGMQFRTQENGNYINVLRLSYDGNVGIGTSNPSAKLDVNGDIHMLGGALQFNRTYVDSGNVLTFHTKDNNRHGDFSFTSERTDNNTSKNLLFIEGDSGEVGIGTASPSAKLDVNGNIHMLGGALQLNRTYVDSGNVLTFHTKDNNRHGDFSFTSERTDNNTSKNLLFIEGDSGEVGIGTTNPTEKLAVNGTIRAKEVIVESGWSDYVFKDEYRLAPLAEVEAHITARGHLPGIPSATEIEQNGAKLSELVTLQMAKIEELTLHLIEKEKQLEAERLRNKEQAADLMDIFVRLKALEN